MTRVIISKQLEKSTVEGSVVVTDGNNNPFYLEPGSEGQILTIVGGVPDYQDPAHDVEIGAILTVGNADAALIDSNRDIRLAPVTATTPGIIDGNDQILFNGKKTVRKSAAGVVTTALGVRNESALNDDDGVQLTFEGDSGVVLGAAGAVIVGGSPTGGTRAFLGGARAGVIYPNFEAISTSNTARTVGFRGANPGIVAGTLNVNSSLSLRAGLYIITDAGSSLNLPDPNLVDAGTYFDWINTVTSGAPTTITSAAANGFWDGQSNTPSATVTIVSGSVRGGRFQAVNTGLAQYWLMVVFPSSTNGLGNQIMTYSAGNGAIVTATGPGVTFVRTTASQWDVTVPANVDLLSLDINSNASQSATASLEVFVTFQGSRPFNQDTTTAMSDGKVPIITTLRKLNPATYPTTAATNNAAWTANVPVAGKLRLATVEFSEVSNGGANGTSIKMQF